MKTLLFTIAILLMNVSNATGAEQITLTTECETVTYFEYRRDVYDCRETLMMGFYGCADEAVTEVQFCGERTLERCMEDALAIEDGCRRAVQHEYRQCRREYKANYEEYLRFCQ
jgi:hypothetical protein